MYFCFIIVLKGYLFFYFSNVDFYIKGFPIPIDDKCSGFPNET